MEGWVGEGVEEGRGRIHVLRSLKAYKMVLASGDWGGWRGGARMGDW